MGHGPWAMGRDTLFRVGTRRSPLAKAQTAWVVGELSKADPSARFGTVEIVTTGDRIADRPLTEEGGKGLFVKELEEALLDRRIDLAVHSAKDLPASLAPGLTIASVPPREDPRDCLVTLAPCAGLAALPKGARVGTTSPRRRSQALALRPDLAIVPLRGNVDTRLKRLGEGKVDAILLAAAGLRRLGLFREAGGPPFFRVLPESEMLPAAGQGTLALEARETDAATASFLKRIEDPAARLELEAERAILARIGGDCRTPFAARAGAMAGGIVRVSAALWTLEGGLSGRGEAEGTPATAAAAVFRRLTPS